MKRLVLYIWSAPWGVVGLLVWLLFKALGWVHGGAGVGSIAGLPFAVIVVVKGPLADVMVRRGWAGLTIGWTVLLWGTPRERTSGTVLHELRHVWQGLRWGILFPFAYLTLLVIYGYQRHPFEVDARRSEGAVSE